MRTEQEKVLEAQSQEIEDEKTDAELPLDEPTEEAEIEAIEAAAEAQGADRLKRVVELTYELLVLAEDLVESDPEILSTAARKLEDDADEIISPDAEPFQQALRETATMLRSLVRAHEEPALGDDQEDDEPSPFYADETQLGLEQEGD